MSNRLLIKKSSVATKVPLTGDLEYGELAINYADEKIYFKNASNAIKSFSASSGTVTSVAALTLGTTGTDVTSTVANGTTTPVITLNIPTASATNRGALSSADWTTFNNKQPAITLTDTVASWAVTSTFAGVLNPTDVFFKPDGTKMFLSTGTTLNQYTLSTPWDITTAGAVTSFTNTWDTVTNGMFISPDGTKLVTCGQTAIVNAGLGIVASEDRAYYLTLSTAWDITTATLVSSLKFGAGTAGLPVAETAPHGITFNSDGTIMYMIGTTVDAIYQYTLTTAYDVSTATYSKQISIALVETAGSGIRFNIAGTRMYIIGTTYDNIVEYRLSTAWDIATAVYYDDLYIVSSESTSQGLYLDETSGNAYIVGTTSDLVTRFNTNSVGILLAPVLATGRIDLAGETRIKNASLLVNGNIYSDGSGVFSGNIAANQIITSASAITLGASVTTGNATLATAQSTGLITIGGIAGTGAITLGQSTAAQTLNLGTGATAAAITKIVNIGTSGVSTSVTNINLGSDIAGALNTVVLNGTIKLPAVGTSGFVKLGAGGQLSADTTTYATGTGTASGTNTGDNAINTLYSGLVSNATHTGDVTGSTALTLATVNANIGTWNNVTVNGKGLVTAGSNTAYLTAEADTLATVTTRGNSTTNGILVGGITTGVAGSTRGTIDNGGALGGFYLAEAYPRFTLGRDIGISGGAGLGFGGATGSTYALIGTNGTSGDTFMIKLSAATGTLSTTPHLTMTAAAFNLNIGALQQAGNQVLHAGNYNSYAPTLTGGGASGTWGINITGSAGSVANAVTFTSSGGAAAGTTYNGSAARTIDYSTLGAAASGHNHQYNVNNDWLRDNNDDANVKLYGNTRQMAFRTDGTTEYATGVGGYPFAWMYGGDGAAQRLMLLNTTGDMWTSTNGWLSTALAGKQNTGSYLTAESDTLATVTGRGASTSTASTFSGGLTATGLTVSKSGTDSLITFPAQTNDPGYIKHYENNNAAIMYFSVSDDTGAADYFSFGSTPGGTYTEGLRLTAGGVVSVGTWQASSISTTYTDAKITSIAATTPIVASASTGAVTLSHATSGVSAGTYNNVTVNTFGHVTAGSNTAYLTALSDTLQSVMSRGATTSTTYVSTTTTPFAFQSNSNGGTYNQTQIYVNQNNTSGSASNGIVIERGRLTDSGSAEIRSFTIAARGGQVQWQVDGNGNTTQTGSLSAISKSFLIDHPTKPGMQLRYGSLEGPENGVYIRGRLKGNKIELPEYWTKLVDPDSITVNLTAIGKSQDIYVEDIIDNVVYVGGENVNCFYTVFAERVDIAKLEVEIA